MAVDVNFHFENDAEAVELLNKFCIRHRYQSIIANPAFNPQEPVDPDTNPETIPNPETKLQFWKRGIIQYTKEQAREGNIMANRASLDAMYNTYNVT